MGRPPLKAKERKQRFETSLSTEALARLDHMAVKDGRTWRGRPNRSAILEDLVMAAKAYTREDIIDSTDKNAILCARLGELDMGGWPTDDEDAFREALADELAYVGTGELTIEERMSELVIAAA